MIPNTECSIQVGDQTFILNDVFINWETSARIHKPFLVHKPRWSQYVKFVFRYLTGQSYKWPTSRVHDDLLPIHDDWPYL